MKKNYRKWLHLALGLGWLAIFALEVTNEQKERETFSIPVIDRK